MEHEQRDTYLIPPNFIEGGTLLGGMFKTRNVIEAGILGAVVGLPVLHLGFSLTTRIIILCLTALSSPVIKCKKTPRKKCSFVAEVKGKR